MSTIWADGESERITPFIAAGYPEAEPKSLSNVMHAIV
jgi:hypothetical protein